MSLPLATPELEPDRLRRLIDVGRGLLSELRLDVVLDRLLETARELTGAQHAALGILDSTRSELAQFLTRGIDAERHRAIGDLPRGRGILGVLIDDPRPLRLDSVSDDPRSYGFPVGHPRMESFLGVPILVRGQAWGNLYLTDKTGGGPFDETDEASVVVLADWAAIAIENARLYERLEERRGELERAVRGFEATAAIARAVGAETDIDLVLELVVKRARALFGARSVLVLLREGDRLVVRAGAGHVGRGEPSVSIDSLFGDVLQDRRIRRLDDVEAEPRLDSSLLGVPDASAALIAPLVYRSRALGVLVAFDRLDEPASFRAEDEEVMAAFAASAATAVATAKSVEADRLRHSLQAAEAERRRWARELHDETLQALGGLKVVLSGAARTGDLEHLQATVTTAVEHVTQEIQNLRTIIAELRPAALDDLGLEPALETLAQRLGTNEGIEVRTDIHAGAERRPEDLETTVYRVAQEAMTNVAKHAGATRVSVQLVEQGGRIVLTVEDDGVGFDPQQVTAGFGLLGMRERAELAGGTIRIEPLEPGTRLIASFPL